MNYLVLKYSLENHFIRDAALPSAIFPLPLVSSFPCLLKDYFVDIS